MTLDGKPAKDAEDNKMLFEKLEEYSCNENRERIVNEIVTKIRKYLSERYRETILQTDVDFRWKNGGKEIYEKMQNAPGFMQSVG